MQRNYRIGANERAALLACCCGWLDCDMPVGPAKETGDLVNKELPSGIAGDNLVAAAGELGHHEGSVIGRGSDALELVHPLGFLGAGVWAEERGPELAEGGVVPAPSVADESQHGIELLGDHAAGRRPSSGKCSNENELRYPLWMASRIGRADRSALASAQQRELVEADRGDESLEVRERALKGEVIDIPIGEATATLVIAEKSVVAHDLRKPVPAIRNLPFKVEVVEPIDGTHQGRAASADGVGKSHTVAGGKELDFLFGWRVSDWGRYDRLRGRRTRDLPHVGNKAITLPRHGLDELLAVRAVL